MRAGRESGPMQKSIRCFVLLSVLVGACSALTAPAAADAGVSILGGPAFVLNSNSVLPTVLTSVGLGYDLGPKTIVPIRFSVEGDYAGGSGHGGSLDEYELGVGARLTTPLYVGVTASVYSASVHPAAFSGGVPGPGASSSGGLSGAVFAGEKLFGLPGGAGVSLQATYRRLSAGGGYNPNSLTVGLRVNL